MAKNEKLKAAILIISETAAQDPSSDKGIPALQQTFAGDGGDQWDVADTKIVPDNTLGIQRAIASWCDGSDYYNVVVTSGGTGFAQKDITPEVNVCTPHL